MTDHTTAPERTYDVAVLDGDGVGPSLVAAALLVNEVTERRHRYRLALDRVELPERHPRIGPEELARLRRADAVFKGPAGLPERRGPDGTETALLGGVLRPALDTYANVRPIRSWSGGPRLSPGSVPIDYVIVRENVEGLYASRVGGARSPYAAADVLIASLEGTRRIARLAFACARHRAESGERREVLCVDKANVLPSHAYFREIVSQVATEFPDVGHRAAHADAVAQGLLLEPWTFDVLVMENFVGDILSEVGAATVGGVGMQSSANIGEHHAYFEPAHGSAPSLAGRDAANPIGQILALAMMLDHLGESAAARAITRAVGRALETRAVRIDDAGCPTIGTDAAARAISELVT